MPEGAWYSHLHWVGQHAIGLVGDKQHNTSPVQLYDFMISGEIKQRCDACPAAGLSGAFGGGSVIQGLIIQHTKVGMWLDGPFSDLMIVGNIISDTNADGINLHAAVTNVTVQDNHIRNTGDDGIAEWSDRQCGVDCNAGPNSGITIAWNTIQTPILANCIALYGGRDHTVADNILADPVIEGGALHVGNRFTSYPLAGHTVLRRNSLIRGSTMDPNWKFGIGSTVRVFSTNIYTQGCHWFPRLLA
jgi:hypothetical protein